MKIPTLASAILFFFFASFGLLGGTITHQATLGYLHSDGALRATLSPSSSGYSASYLGDGTGTFGWTFTNETGRALSNIAFSVFLDADIDRDSNTFFNEYGEFIGLTLPVFAPVGSLAASSWEVDEPGLVFGDILLNLGNGALDGTNGVPSSAPDDVSLALGFKVGSLAPNATLHTHFSISRTNIGGLRQVDPDSELDFYLNGYALIEAGTGPPSGIPEPRTALLFAAGLAAIWKIRR